MPNLFTTTHGKMQKVATTVVIHLPNITEFCAQSNGRAYLLEASKVGQHFKNWYLYITGYDQWGNPIMLTLHVGETFISDTRSASEAKERLTQMRKKVEEILIEKDIICLNGFIGTEDQKIIGEI